MFIVYVRIFINICNLSFTDIALKDPISIADSLYNIQLIRLFCERYLPEKCHHLTVNDIFHGVSDLKVSFVVLVAELFNWLEVKKISVCADVRKTVQTRNMTDTEGKDGVCICVFLGVCILVHGL